MEPITLLISALVTARITRLITRDRITMAPRRWLLQRLPNDGMMAYLIVCDWCSSVYVGLGVAAGGAVAGWWTGAWIVPLGLAFSYVAGWLASKEDE